MGSSERRKVSLINMDLMAIWLPIAVAVVTFTSPASSSEPRVVCYYTNWSVYRPGTARFNPQNINPYLCTHLIYAFGGFTKDNAFKPFDKYQDIEKGGYAKFTGLKTYNKNLKTLLAIGGWNEGSSRFSPMVASRERRKEFVRNAIKFLRQNRFDGLDLDWEYPAFRDGSKPKDRENYAKLVKELREEFEKESQKTGKPRLLLTMAVPAGIEYIQKGFDVKTLNQYLDWMNLLTYDYHSAFEPAVNHHAPLYPLEEPNEYSVDNELNIDYTIKFYLDNGADRDKLVLGIPTYGRSYSLFNPDATEIGSPADGPGEQGDATREKGYLAYYEICESLKPKSRKREIDSDDETEDEDSEEEEDLPWTVVQPNPRAMGPYAYRGNQWVGYDDIDIVSKKAEYVAENGLGGIMFWSIDNDDFRGTCHGKPYPLIEAAKEAYISRLGSTDNAVAVTERARVSSSSSRRRNRPRGSSTTASPAPAAKLSSSTRRKSAVSSTTPAWSISTPEPPTTPDPGADFKCTDEGFFQHPRDCKKYFWCLDSGPSNLGIVAHQFTCPSGLFFNKAADSCDFARNVLCKKPSTTTTTKAPPKSTTATPQTTTRAPTTTEATTTTRRAIKLSTKNSALFRTTSTTTTAEEIYDDSEEDTADIDAEDPKVIKELIDLIRKVGGVEQLEKHLHLAESAADGASTTTASPYHKKLYQKVLERTRSNKIVGSGVGEGAVSYSRRGPQNAGLESGSDSDSEQRTPKRDGRPQYTTINRSRGTTTEQPSDSVEAPAVPEVSNRARAVDDSQSNSNKVDDPRSTSDSQSTGDSRSTTSRPLQYVNIRRARPTDTADDTASRNALFERSEPYVTVSETPSSLDIAGARRENIPEYVTIRRNRPTTEEATTAQYTITEEASYETLLEKEISSPLQPQYTSIERRRPTTPPTEPDTPEPTTVLAVQISSLLNAPNPEDDDVLIQTEAELEATEPLTTVTTPVPTTSPPRRAAPRRRGTTTPAPLTSTLSTTTQVSDRNYTFVRRRRPLARPNEINADSDETNSRKIRSTTPESREAVVNAETERTSVVFSRRFRSRNQQSATPVVDSVPAAASPVSRGRYRPQVDLDELSTLTAVETEQDVVPQFVPRSNPNTVRSSSRFRSRTSTVADSVADSDTSAAAVEVQRQTFPLRRRSRFFLSTSTTVAPQEISTTIEPSQRRPTFTRFSPRPFSRSGTPSTTEEAILEEIVDEPIIATPRTPSRLPFGRGRPAISTTTTTRPNIQARRLPFSSYSRQSTTQVPFVNENEDESIENTNDDIKLSESAIAEKEHENENINEPDQENETNNVNNEPDQKDNNGSINEPEEVSEAPKRRVIIKKVRPSSAPEEDLVIPSSDSPVSLDETGRKKFRVIRRRPTSTTTVAEDITTISTSETPPTGPQRVRKIIRKKIKPVEDDIPEIIAKSVGSFNAGLVQDTTEPVANYGEKTRPNILAPSSTSAPVEEEQVGSEPTESNQTELPEIKEQQNENIGDTKAVEEENKHTTETETELETKPEVFIENNQASIDVSENKEVAASSEPTIVTESEIQPETEASTKPTSTQGTSTSPRARQPYRPSKRLFTSTTETPAPSSRTYSRKYNAVYTSPATVDRPSTTRRPLFQGRPFSRRPFTTARTTPKIEDEDEYSDEEILDEEPEDEFVVVPPNQLFSRRPTGGDITDDDNEESNQDLESDNEGESEDEGQEQFTVTSRKPNFKPRVVNSNTFRTSTSTTELPKRQFGSQNKTAIFNRFGGNRPVNETKKRVVNVPVGYNTPSKPSSDDENESKTSQVEEESDDDQTITTTDGKNTESTTEEDDYLTMTDSTSTTESETATNNDSTNTETFATVTDQMEIDDSTDDFLEFAEETTSYPGNSDTTFYTNDVFDEKTTYFNRVTVATTTVPEATTEPIPETTTTTTTTKAPPIVKTQFNKLFSVSRVVEVSSKLDKHRINKNNESRLIEEGTIMQEKKPTVDKIGEVSRFSLIKIFEDEIPIYLTKYGHIYPVDNPPHNPIRIDEARNARALVNFSDAPRENLLASESINEAYRSLNKISQVQKEQKKETDQVEHIQGDNFLSYINDEKKADAPYSLPYYQSDPSQWQFIPAAYENEKMKQNKAAKTFEIVTPRNVIDDPSTLPLEGLFKTENPVTARKINNIGIGNQPFLVYSSTAVKEDPIMNLTVSKQDAGKNIKTYVKGQELVGAVADDVDDGYPVDMSVIPLTTESSDSTATTMDMTETVTVTTSPILEMLTTPSTTVTTEPTTVGTTNEPTVETIVEETTTQKPSLFDGKRSKFAFPRRPIGVKTNTTRPVPVISSRIAKKNVTLSSNSLNRVNKTSGFNPTKSRFTAARAQNVPVDLRSGNRKTTARPVQRTYTTEAPRSTTEKRVLIKSLRSNFRPSFVPRKPTPTTKAQKDRRNNFLRRTKATAPPDTTDPATTESAPDTTTSTQRYTRRGNSKFKTNPGRKDAKKETKVEKEQSNDGGKIEIRTRQPSLNNANRSAPARTFVRRRLGGANATTQAASGTTSPSLPTTRRPFRVASRRRPVASTVTTVLSTTSTTADTKATSPVTPGSTTVEEKSTTAETKGPTTPATTTLASEEVLQDIEERDSIEDPSLAPRNIQKTIKKTVKIQRRPLTSLRETVDLNPSATNEDRKGQKKNPPTNEDDRKRQSKKYSSSFKQNQLDEVIRLKSKSQEEFDAATQSATENDNSAETAVAIAAHQLLSAPLPADSFADQARSRFKKTSQKSFYPTTKSFSYTSTVDFDTDHDSSSRLSPGFTTPSPIYRGPSFSSIANREYSSSPGYSTTVIPISGYSSGLSKTSGYSSTPSYSSTSRLPYPTAQRPSGFTTAGFLSGGFSISPALGPSTARFLHTSNKYEPAPIDDFGGYTSGDHPEPAYFTREYLLESPVTKTYDDQYQYLSPASTEPSTTRKLPKKTVFRRISTTLGPTAAALVTTAKPRRAPQRKPFEKISKAAVDVPSRTYRPMDNYDYYDDSDEKLATDKQASKVILHGKGSIECLDIGNFPHPTSCKKFISCARMEGGATVGWEYVCPVGLSFDPVGGICNWSAGLGCDEN